MERGVVGFVLPKQDNLVYAVAQEGDLFGASDFIEDENDTSLQIKRKHDVLCLSPKVEVLSIDCMSFREMQEGFPNELCWLLERSYDLSKELADAEVETMKDVNSKKVKVFKAHQRTTLVDPKAKKNKKDKAKEAIRKASLKIDSTRRVALAGRLVP